MSKQSEAKEKQGYVPKMVPQSCGNCAHLQFEKRLPAWMRLENAASEALGKMPRYWDGSKVETNFRCGIGGFAVKKTGTCNEWGGK